MASGDGAAVCRVDSATCAAIGDRLAPAKPADNKAIESEMRAEARGPPPAVSG